MKKIRPYLIIMILSVICFLAVRGCMKQKKENKSFRGNYEALQDSAQLLRDRNGILHAQNANLQLSKKQAKTFYGAQIDSMADLLKIKPLNIKSVVYVPFQADVNIDSLKAALVTTDTIQIIDTVPGRMKVNGLMSLTKYEKGTGFLNLNKKQFLDVHFDNPIFHPLDVRGFDITEKPKRLGIGPYLGYGWDGVRWAPSVGVSIHYDLIRF